MNRFLDKAIDNTSLPGEEYDYDPIEDLRLQFEELGINQAKIAHAVSKLSQYKCSECGKTGHNSCNCSKNKKKSRSSRSSKNKSGRSSKSRSKKKGNVNIAIIDSGSSSDSGTNFLDNESNSSSDSGSSSGSESDSDSENDFTESDIMKIINAVRAKKKVGSKTYYKVIKPKESKTKKKSKPAKRNRRRLPLPASPKINRLPLSRIFVRF